MKELCYRDADFAAQLQTLYRRPSYPAEIECSVRDIIEQVRQHGDAALARYAREFDHAELAPEQFRVSETEIAEAAKAVTPAMRKAIQTALKHVQGFARKRIRRRGIIRPALECASANVLCRWTGSESTSRAAPRRWFRR